MKLYDSPLYNEDVKSVCNLNLPWEKLKNRTVAVSGATGLIGSFFADVILEKNKLSNLGCRLIVLGRSEERVKTRFCLSEFNERLMFVPWDAMSEVPEVGSDAADYVLHLASNTHPLQYAKDPISTITTNVFGLKNMLDFAVRHKACRFVFASSNEIYGENTGNTEFFDEKYCGYIDSNTLRAGYPESKRCGEALCQAYSSQKGLDVVIARFTRSYGPTMLMSDSKAISQFIKRGLNGENIILKSEGNQFYSYQYAADSVSGLLTIMLSGESGQAYNIAEEHSDITLKDLAGLIAGICGSKVEFQLPDSVESSGYSVVSKARLDGQKLAGLGWKPMYDIKTGIKRTIDILSGK